MIFIRPFVLIPSDQRNGVEFDGGLNSGNVMQSILQLGEKLIASDEVTKRDKLLTVDRKAGKSVTLCPRASWYCMWETNGLVVGTAANSR